MTNTEIIDRLKTTPREWVLEHIHQNGEDYYLIYFDGDYSEEIEDLLQACRDNDEVYWALYDGLPRYGMNRHPFDEQLRIDIINAVGLD